MQESIVETLKNMKSEQNLTLQQISSASGVPLSTVNRILSGQTENPSFRDVAAIVAAMDGSLDAITGLQKLESENGQLLDSNVMQLLLSMQNYYAKTLDATRQQYMRELENKDKQYRDILTDKNRWLRRMFFCLIGMLAVICAITGLGIGLSALNGVALGVLVAIILLMIMNRDNKPSTFLNDSERMLSTVGPLSMLPMLLACLGSVFTAAGVGDVISDLVSHIIPEGNVNAGIVVYAIGMMLFTMIMGNAYAAITVMTVGIGYPFVLAHGANPVVIGMLALTCGFCGTLCTPMAANFNTVPVALLDMKKPMGVIKNQVPVAIIMMVVQIVMMILLK